MKKTFKETKVGKFICDKLPEALAIVGDVLPDKGVLGIAKNIIDKSTISAEEKQEMINQLAEFEQTELNAYLADTQDARQREVELKNTLGVYVQNFAAGAVIVAFLVLLFAIVYMSIEVQNKELVYTLLGVHGTLVTQIFQYWFGSSAGSAKANDTLRNVLAKK
jgi:hypothetical protein